jgi:hypothetical protein
LAGVLAALRATAAGSVLVRELTAAPDLDGWVITERLLADLAPLEGRLWLVVDDVQELGGDALRQLELLIMRAPGGLRFVLAARHDVRLGLHRLRLEGELAEIREPDLRFTVAEASELFEAAGVDLPDPAPLVERTEGWAAGLRLAALSLAGHPDPGRLAAEFSGTERTVAEYLLAEVLDRQSQPVRRLLLRTSILERVNGELAGLLTGDKGGERVLAESDPILMAVFPQPRPPSGYDAPSFCARGGRFGPHNQHQQQGLACLAPNDRLVYLAYFGAGLQIYDITDPRDPHITGYYIPDDPAQRRGPIPSKLVHQAEDVLVDRRGVIYMSEGNSGIYILTRQSS